MTYTLITGASKGIGKHIAIECAEMGMNLILVARSMHLLEELKKEITNKVNVDIRLLSADLFKEGSAAEIYDWCSREKLQLDKLVNNAGISAWGNFENLSLTKKKQLMHINVTVVVEMIHLFLPDLLKQPQAYILNVGSIASYMPIPYMAIYGGSKSFVYSYSLALRNELKKTNVSVTCLNPGPTKTELVITAGMKDVEGWKTMFEMNPQSVARAGVLAMLNKKASIVPGWSNKLTVFLSRMLPSSIMLDNTAAIFKDMGKS
jgi:short-subunit dehydrogenase